MFRLLLSAVSLQHNPANNVMLCRQCMVETTKPGPLSHETALLDTRVQLTHPYPDASYRTEAAPHLLR